MADFLSTDVKARERRGKKERIRIGRPHCRQVTIRDKGTSWWPREVLHTHEGITNQFTIHKIPKNGSNRQKKNEKSLGESKRTHPTTYHNSTSSRFDASWKIKGTKKWRRGVVHAAQTWSYSKSVIINYPFRRTILRNAGSFLFTAEFPSQCLRSTIYSQ